MQTIVSLTDEFAGNELERRYGPLYQFIGEATNVTRFAAMRELNLYMNGASWNPDDTDDDVDKRWADLELYASNTGGDASWTEYIEDSRDAA